MRELLQQVLEALQIGRDCAYEHAQHFHASMAGFKPKEHEQVDNDVTQINEVIVAIKAALALPEPEPVAWMIDNDGYDAATTSKLVVEDWASHGETVIPLYAHDNNPQLTRLDDANAIAIANQFGGMNEREWEIVAAFEEAYGIKAKP